MAAHKRISYFFTDVSRKAKPNRSASTTDRSSCCTLVNSLPAEQGADIFQGVERRKLAPAVALQCNKRMLAAGAGDAPRFKVQDLIKSFIKIR